MSVNERSFASMTGALHLPGQGRDAVLPQEVLTRLKRQHPNILLIGPAAFALAALKSIEPVVPQPIVTWRPHDTRGIPSGSFGTLIIHRVDTVDTEQQQQLCEWFEARPRHVQVVSTALAPLYPFVEQGTFLEALYYRLNHVCLVADRPQD
jgi:hypothetical protein